MLTVKTSSRFNNLRVLRFFFLRRLIQFCGAVNQNCWLQSDCEKPKQTAHDSANRQPIQNVTDYKCVQERLGRLFSHVILSLSENRLELLFCPGQSTFRELFKSC